MSERDIRDFINSLSEEQFEHASTPLEQAGVTLGWALLDAIAAPAGKDIEQPTPATLSLVVPPASTDLTRPAQNDPLRKENAVSTPCAPEVHSAATTRFGNIFRTTKEVSEEAGMHCSGSLKALLKSIASCR
ncbi:hypothetical protein IQ22_01638 [Pseudomonas duriflava]|uniref:Uncharacterized protein n=1 Tax=Pseudomonas duriflava TaxID=459528 RepID=A0A562QG28_9PSED|nr:hypothetical protein [Pseudomonas duriflava]TWI55705.1 hypothetical protein IQ22_01638 [Pseudomonas duriflava]